jgi:hypothetical protein
MGCTVAPNGAELDCPCHRSRYNALTGRVIQGPAPALPKIAVSVQDGDVVTGKKDAGPVPDRVEEGHSPTCFQELLCAGRMEIQRGGTVGAPLSRPAATGRTVNVTQNWSDTTDNGRVRAGARPPRPSPV